MKCMLLFTKHDFIYKMLYVGEGRKKNDTKKKKAKKKRKVTSFFI